MKAPRIVNRGRVAPSSPQPIIDSGRTSWSSASAVSTIDTKSPEPRLPDEVAEKLQESLLASAAKRRLLIGLGIAAALIIIVCIVLAVVLPLTLIKSTAGMNSTAATPSTNRTTSGFK